MRSTAADIQQLRDWFRLTDATRDPILARLIESAFLFCEGETGLLFEPKSFSEVYSGDGTAELIPAQQPLVSVSSLTIDGEAVTASTGYDVDGYLLLPASNPYKVVLRGSVFTAGDYNVELVFTAGAAPSEAVRLVALELAANKYKRPDIHLQASQQLAQQTVSFTHSDLNDSMKATLSHARIYRT